jgi:hypothetical protein
MRRTTLLLGVIALCGCLAAPVEAADTGWRLRFFAAGFDPDLDTTVTNSDGDDIRVTADTDLGYGVSLEYRFSDLVGLELGVSAGDPDVELSAEVPPFGDVLLSDSLSTRVVTLDVDFHLTPGSPSLDFYLGAGIADVSYGDLHYVGPDDEPLDLRISGDYTWSAKVGLDIALGGNGKWAVIGGFRYIDSEVEGREAQDPPSDSATFASDIYSVSVGIAYRI